MFRTEYPITDYVIGLSFYTDSDPGKAPPYLTYKATNEEDLKYYIFEYYTQYVAWEIIKIQNNDRYGKKELLFERDDKYWMECHLNILKPLLPPDRLEKII